MAVKPKFTMKSFFFYLWALMLESLTLLTYRRPASGKSDSTSNNDIAASISFEAILDGATCPPCTLLDFLVYLMLIQKTPESLLFIIWYLDYSQRYQNYLKTHHAPRKSIDAMAIGLPTPPLIPAEPLLQTWTAPWLESSTLLSTMYPLSWQVIHEMARITFSQVQRSLPLLISNDFKSELERVIAIFFSANGPYELNISDKKRKNLLNGLHHPYPHHLAAFNEIAQDIDQELRTISHPEFIRYTIQNGNKSRQTFAFSLGIFLFILGTALSIVISVTNWGRGLHAVSALLWLLGFATYFCATRGMCVVLHGLHKRQLKPWELLLLKQRSEDGDSGALVKSLDDLLDLKSQAWAAKYDGRSFVAKVFDKEAWILDPGLRKLQWIIFAQGMVMGALIAGFLAVVFLCAVPKKDLLHA